MARIDLSILTLEYDWRVLYEPEDEDGEEEDEPYLDEEMERWNSVLSASPTPLWSCCTKANQTDTDHRVQDRQFRPQGARRAEGVGLRDRRIRVYSRLSLLHGRVVPCVRPSLLSSSVLDLDTAAGESHRFSCLFDRTAKLRSRFAREGTGVWGPEVTEHSDIAYLEHMRIEPAYRGQGIGAWALKELYKATDGITFAVRWLTRLPRHSSTETLISQETDFLFVQPGALEEEFPSHDPFSPDPYREAKLAMSDRITRFYQRVHLSPSLAPFANADADALLSQNGFRRVGTTSYLCLACDPNHPSRRIPIEGDAKFVEDVTMSQGELVGMLARDQMPW